MWCKIGDIADVARGGSPRPIESYLTDDPSGVNWIKIGDAEQGGKYINSTRQRIKPEGVSRSRFVHRGDFLLTNSMSFGRPYILNVDGCIHDGWLVISPFNNVLDKNYFYYLLSSEYAYQQFSEQASGAVVSNLNRDKVASSLIPLPPQKEQIAIASQIDLFFSRIECLESALADVEHCISKVKGKILDYAIHGNLVTQNPSDEPAIELLRRINPSFKPSDNLHYEEYLPEGWCIAPLSSFCTTINGLWKGNKEPLLNVGVIRNANFTKDFGLDYSKIEYIDVELKSFEKRNLEDGDIIVEKSGGSDNFPVGRSILFNGESRKYSFSNFTMSLRILDKSLIRPMYLYYVLQHKYRRGDMKQMQTQTTGLHNLLIDKYLSAPIPIPPLGEQERIILSIESLFQTVDGIRNLVKEGE